MTNESAKSKQGVRDGADREVPSPRRLALGPFRLRRLGRRFLMLETEAGAHIEAAQVEALHRAMALLAGGDWFVVLVDKRTRYSFSFEAQRILYKVPRLAAVAIVMESPSQLPALRSTLDVGKEHAKCKIHFYYALQPALRWLRALIRERASWTDPDIPPAGGTPAPGDG